MVSDQKIPIFQRIPMLGKVHCGMTLSCVVRLTPVASGVRRSKLLDFLRLQEKQQTHERIWKQHRRHWSTSRRARASFLSLTSGRCRVRATSAWSPSLFAAGSLTAQSINAVCGLPSTAPPSHGAAASSSARQPYRGTSSYFLSFSGLFFSSLKFFHPNLASRVGYRFTESVSVVRPAA